MELGINQTALPSSGPTKPDIFRPDTDAFTASFADAIAILRLDIPVPLTGFKEGFADGASGTAVVGTDPNLMNTNTDLSKGGSGLGVTSANVSTGSRNG